jgi:hypothetical protein
VWLVTTLLTRQTEEIHMLFRTLLSEEMRKSCVAAVDYWRGHSDFPHSVDECDGVTPASHLAFATLRKKLEFSSPALTLFEAAALLECCDIYRHSAAGDLAEGVDPVEVDCMRVITAVDALQSVWLTLNGE